MRIFQFSLEVSIKLDDLVMLDRFCRTRLDPRQVNAMMSKDIQSALEDSSLIIYRERNGCPILDLPVGFLVPHIQL